jgi:ubiquinone/menaquinone biosynthesis C-methylase UbiE
VNQRQEQEGLLIGDLDLFKASVAHYDTIQEVIAEALRIRLGARRSGCTALILEAGVGTGATTEALLRANVDIHIIGVDCSEVAIKAAQERLGQLRRPVEFIHHDILSVISRLPADSVDGFVSGFTLHNLSPDDRRVLISEVGRVVKGGGVYVNGDKVARDNPARHAVDLKKQLSAFGIFRALGRGDLEVGWTRHYLDDDEKRFTEREQVDLLSGAGFNLVKSVCRRRMEAVVSAVKCPVRQIL